MDKLKTIASCVVPFMVAAGMLYPFAAIIGASWDAFTWERSDRVFYFICVGVAGGMLAVRVNQEEK